MLTIILRSQKRGTQTRVQVASLPCTLSAEVTRRVLADLGGNPDGPQSHAGRVLDVGTWHERLDNGPGDWLLTLSLTGELSTTHRPGPRAGTATKVKITLSLAPDVIDWLRMQPNISAAVEALVRAEIARERGE